MSPSCPYEAVAPDVLEVEIEIRPLLPNVVIPNGPGVILVGIKTTPSLNALTVNPATVRFGPAGASWVGIVLKMDADFDGDKDLVVTFRVRDTGIQCGDTEATLTGTTLDGQDITGTDSIVTVLCRR
jgi:hypothetical protein